MGEMEDESEWIARSRNGDHAAFAELIHRHQPMIHSLTYRMTGSLADCKDLAQETFIRAHERLDGFEGNSKFSSWLYRIAVNTCLDWQRRESRRGRLHEQWSAENIHESAPEESPAEDAVSRQVQAALMKLPERQRAAIALTVYG